MKAKRAPPRADVQIPVMRLAHGADLPLPSYQSEHAAGMDLLAATAPGTVLVLMPGERRLVPTGLSLAIPRGFEGQIRPRSGMALREGVTVLNSPGTIDADYRGEVMVLLVNLGDQAVGIRRGERIAQLVIAPVARATLKQASALEASRRGAGGFGSTGKDTARAAKSGKTIPRARRK
jgi:dUTP pyrophosphatase